MTVRSIRIAMNGVTGRMGYHQHLVRSILAIRDQGGISLPDGGTLVPEPVLVGRNADRLRAIAQRHGLSAWTTSLEKALADTEVYFDAQVTSAHEAALRTAIEAGKHVYTEKPVAETLDAALALAALAAERGVCNGVVQDKLYLPGLRKLRRLVDTGFFGRILSVGIEFGYWVFDGSTQAGQRPSWNFKAAEGGGMISDMFPHWRYVLDEVIAPVRSVYAVGATQIPARHDTGGRYAATADDAAYAICGLDGGITATIRSSWATRVYRDELVAFHVDGTDGSAEAGLWSCRAQHAAVTPRAVWNPDVRSDTDHRAGWQEVPDNQEFDNAFKVQWERFLRHVVAGTPYRGDLLAGAAGVQLAELAQRSWRTGTRVEVPELTAGSEGTGRDRP